MLENVLEQIKAEKAVAEIDLETISRQAYPYKKGQVESAKERLESLYIEYKNEILKRSLFILVTGDESEKFAEIAKEEYQCFAVDASTMFKEVVKEISPQLYEGKTANSAIFDVIDSVLEQKMKSLDVISYNSLMFNTKYQRLIANKSDMINMVQEAVTDIVGGEIVAVDALERVAKEAVNKEYKSKIVPVVIYSKNFSLIEKLSSDIMKTTPRVATVVAGEIKGELNVKVKTKDIDLEKVGEALKKIATNA